MRKLFNDENGFIVSAELVLVMTIGVLSMVVGLASVSHSITAELCDVSSAFGAIDQTFTYKGVRKPTTDCAGKPDHGRVEGAGFNDAGDNCDCAKLEFTVDVCGKDQVGGNGRDESGN